MHRSSNAADCNNVLYCDAMTYLITAIGLPPGGSSTVQYSTHLHTNNTQNDTKQTIHRTTQFRKSADRAPSLQVIPWHLRYN
jgi:hypothetical protein